MVLGKSIKTLIKHPKLCLPCVVFVFLLFGIPLLSLLLFESPQEVFIEFFNFLAIPLSIFFYLAMSVVCILMVYDLEQNGGISCCSAFKKCFGYLTPVLISSLLVGIIVAAGILAFVIPGIYLICRLSLTEHAIVIEKKRATESIERSWNLTRGRASEIFGILFIPGLIFGILLLLFFSFFPIIGSTAAITAIIFVLGILVMVLLFFVFALVLPVIATTYYYLELTEE